MMYKAVHGLAAAYLSELCASSCVEGRTRSSAHGDLVVQASADEDKVRRTCICRRRSGGMELRAVAVLRSQLSFLGQSQDGSEDIFLRC